MLSCPRSCRALRQTAKKDALWAEIWIEVGTSGQDVRWWFQSQCTRYGKFTADIRKSGSGKNFQMTERAKWLLHHFSFLDGSIMMRATVETAGFLCSTVQSRSPNESRGSGTATDVENAMEHQWPCPESATKFFFSDCIYTCTVARPGHGRHVPPDSGHAL